MKAITTLIFLLLLTSANLLAQTNYTLSGTIVDKGLNEGIEGATVQLLSLPDSTFVMGTVADTDGKFLFENVKKASRLRQTCA